MYAHSVDYRKDDPHRGQIVNRGFWLNDLPRVMLVCRLLRRHKPVVDGYGPHRPGLDAARWVCCDRCGVRPDPQGNLDPEQWAVGQPYAGPFDGIRVGWENLRGPELLAAMKDVKTRHTPPGPWPTSPKGGIGGQLILGKTFGLFGFEVKVGNAGSENTLAASLRIWPFGALYLHTERFGTWLQRRLVPKGYHSRVISLDVDDWRIRWQLWARRDESSISDPWWMRGSINLDLAERILGPKRYDYTDVGDPLMVTVRMPHGDDHDVELQLQRRAFGRRRGRKSYGWSVDWSARPGIPTKPGDRGSVWGSAVDVTDQAAEAGDWPMVAAAAIASTLTADRSRYGYRPSEETSAL